MSKPKTIREIVLAGLQQYGYDGLVTDDCECGCTLEDFVPCGELHEDCRPGFKGTNPSGECTYLMYHTREAARVRKEGE